MRMQLPRGTEDLLPEAAKQWRYVEDQIRVICDLYSYGEIRTPVFEHTEVYLRGVGDTTDIVQKEMYTFYDRGGRSLTLRPEGTAGVVRSFIEHKMYGEVIQPTKLFYFAQMFRYERPEKGRLRQLNQFGIEVLGSASPSMDAEVIGMGMHIYQKLGIQKLKLLINSLGDTESRKNYRESLIEYFTPYKEDLCEDCQDRLESNPLRVLDCKKDAGKPEMVKAPVILDYLTEESSAYFAKLKQNLEVMGIPYEVDPRMVRGLDYYNDTVFEIVTDVIGGKELTLLGGGRYSGLVKQLGGPEVDGIGFGLGMERMLMALDHAEINLPVKTGIDLYIVTTGDDVELEGVKLLKELRMQGISAEMDYQSRKIKGQFKMAERVGARNLVVLGQEEIKTGRLKLKTLGNTLELDVELDNLVNKLIELRNQ